MSPELIAILFALFAGLFLIFEGDDDDPAADAPGSL